MARNLQLSRYEAETLIDLLESEENVYEGSEHIADRIRDLFGMPSLEKELADATASLDLEDPEKRAAWMKDNLLPDEPVVEAKTP